MSSAYVASNKASSTLAANINTTATSITVATGEGARFPSPTGGDYTLVTLQNASGQREIVCIVGRSTDVLTVGIPGSAAANVAGRNYESIYGMTAASWVIGDAISVRPTASLVEDGVAGLAAAVAAQADATTAIADAATAQATADAALPKAGGTMTGNITMGVGTKLIYEGTTDDAFELTVDPGDPTADRTQTYPDMSGVIAVQARGADIASASTINLATATGDIVDVTGTTAITAITLTDGIERKVRFTGALTLTHGASLILPGAANITTAAGDFATFRGYAAGVVRCTAYQPASGAPVSGASVFTDTYDSGEQTISTSGTLDLTHGLGAIPKVVMFTAKCLTGELGFSAGDELYLGGGGNAYNGSGSSNRQGFSATLSSTNIYIRFSDEAAALGTIRKDSGDFGGMTNANWAFIVRAYV